MQNNIEHKKLYQRSWVEDAAFFNLNNDVGYSQNKSL